MSSLSPLFLHKSICVFDFDGTLVDSMQGFADLAASLMAKHYACDPLQARQNYLRTSGLPFFEQLEVLFPQDSRNTQVAQLFESQKAQGYSLSPFFEEVPGVINHLQSEGIRVVISSNNQHELVLDYLEKGPSLSFDLVLGFKENFAKGKAHFDKIREHFNCELRELLFVGDSIQDAKKALDFGLDFVGRTGTFTSTDFLKLYPHLKTVDNLKELTPLLCKS